MKLIHFNNEIEYQTTQIKMGEQGFNDRSVWVSDAELDVIVDYIHNNKIDIKNILCHGVRTGYEVAYLEKKLQPQTILGTDISPTASSLHNVIVHDFHYVKQEWLGYYDLIYSNSLDHSNRPEQCVLSWLSCLSDTGVCFIEWSTSHTEQASMNSVADCFGATADEYKNMFMQVGNIVDIIDLYSGSDNIKLFVLTKKRYEE